MVAEVKRPKDMVNNTNLGKWMSWGDIVKAYPNRWIYLTNYELDENSDIVGGILSVVCCEPEFSLVEDIIGDKSKKGILDRTTELPGNILWVE